MKKPAPAPAPAPALRAATVSPGCPKALVVSERILTRLRPQGGNGETQVAPGDTVKVTVGHAGEYDLRDALAKSGTA